MQLKTQETFCFVQVGGGWLGDGSAYNISETIQARRVGMRRAPLQLIRSFP